MVAAEGGQVKFVGSSLAVRWQRVCRRSGSGLAATGRRLRAKRGHRRVVSEVLLCRWGEAGSRMGPPHVAPNYGRRLRPFPEAVPPRAQKTPPRTRSPCVRLRGKPPGQLARAPSRRSTNTTASRWRSKPPSPALRLPPYAPSRLLAAAAALRPAGRFADLALVLVREVRVLVRALHAPPALLLCRGARGACFVLGCRVQDARLLP